ncbi:type II toxin-antitoxin system RelE/ParE family toxin [Algoriphagus sp.]|uniref:type II toxin-antitoxin system RelE/ParE family toxin n=1 Tax=Algoriphagus sp. TaxID=1872435 RepID=UPI003918A3AE
MIKSIKHKSLKNYWIKGDTSKLPSTMVGRIKIIMDIIDSIERVPDDLFPFPNLKPHPLKGNRKGDWSLEVSGNWRMTFYFDNETASAYDVDLEDYH